MFRFHLTSIFDGFMKTEVRISGPLLEMDRTAHMRLATRTLREEIASGKVDAKIFTSEQLRMITAGEEKIPGYTWHHHQEMGRMQLVQEKVHNELKHIGGDNLWRR